MCGWPIQYQCWVQPITAVLGRVVLPCQFSSLVTASFCYALPHPNHPALSCTQFRTMCWIFNDILFADHLQTHVGCSDGVQEANQCSSHLCRLLAGFVFPVAFCLYTCVLLSILSSSVYLGVDGVQTHFVAFIFESEHCPLICTPHLM